MVAGVPVETADVSNNGPAVPRRVNKTRTCGSHAHLDIEVEIVRPYDLVNGNFQRDCY
jgi:hypothetical protein